MGNSERKKALILTIAFECFSIHGYTRSTFKDVARRAGISRASLYTYFKNKRDLFITMNQEIDANHYQKSAEIRARSVPDREKVMDIIHEWIIQPYIDIQGTPYANGWLDELVSISKETEQNFRELFIRSLEPLIGEERAEVIVYSVRGLMDDRPNVEHLKKRIMIMVNALV